MTILATDVIGRLGYDPANPALTRQRIVTGSGIEYAPAPPYVLPLRLAKTSPASTFCATTCLLKAASTDFSESRHFKLTISFRKGIIDLSRER